MTFEKKLAEQYTLNREAVAKAQAEAQARKEEAQIKLVVEIMQKANEDALLVLKNLRNIRETEKKVKNDLEERGRYIEHAEAGLAEGKIGALAPLLTKYYLNMLQKFDLQPQELPKKK